jgi:hypothetical protein
MISVTELIRQTFFWRWDWPQQCTEQTLNIMSNNNKLQKLILYINL